MEAHENIESNLNFLFALLRCPSCNAEELERMGPGLICKKCQNEYEINKSIPVLLKPKK